MTDATRCRALAWRPVKPKRCKNARKKGDPLYCGPHRRMVDNGHEVRMADEYDRQAESMVSNSAG